MSDRTAAQSMFDLSRNESFAGRRSPVVAGHAAVASSQPLATEAGIHVLRAGGTAADAAVAVAAMLQVTQPCSTGLGGDAFYLYYDAASRSVSALNGSGRSAASLTLERAVAAAGGSGSTHLPDFHPYTVTVPGAAAAWNDLLERHGRLSRDQVLAPAIDAAAAGFPVAPATARWWAAGAERQLRVHEHGHELMVADAGGGYRPPRAGERFDNPGLARVLESFAADGAQPFYHGWIAERIVQTLSAEGGLLTAQDLADHHSEAVSPLSITLSGAHGVAYRIWECPPNGHGLAALIALGIYERALDRAADEAVRLHLQIEAMRLAFADTERHLADPEAMQLSPEAFLTDAYLSQRAGLIDLRRRRDHVAPGTPAGASGTDTVYFAVRDRWGNGCSFINSNFMGFGTGIVPRGCGFSLQNRGRGFVLDPAHPNVVAGGKRPYHTIIPGLITRGEADRPELHAVFGVMGGMMQPQGHLQVAASLLHDRLDPQSALDRPRFQLEEGRPDGVVLVEDDLPESLKAALCERGHTLHPVSGARRAIFGLGQVIVDQQSEAADEPVVWAGSDPRGDGCALGF